MLRWVLRRICFSVRAREPTLDEIKPGSADGREMNMKTQTLSQPPLDDLSVVPAVVVHDQMHIQIGRDLRFNAIDKDAELK